MATVGRAAGATLPPLQFRFDWKVVYVDNDKEPEKQQNKTEKKERKKEKPKPEPIDYFQQRLKSAKQQPVIALAYKVIYSHGFAVSCPPITLLHLQWLHSFLLVHKNQFLANSFHKSLPPNDDQSKSVSSGPFTSVARQY